MEHDRELTVFDDGHFRICHCADVDVPGYLIVAAEGEPGAWGDLTGAQRSRLGDVLALAAEAVRAVAGPERVYVCAFGEETPSLHFHLFPRYAWMGMLFQQRTGASSIDGPALLSLMRRERSCAPRAWSDPDGIRGVVRALRRWLREHAEQRFEREGDGR